MILLLQLATPSIVFSWFCQTVEKVIVNTSFSTLNVQDSNLVLDLQRGY
jgi:preprotein translocase subunit SecB